MGIFDQSEFDIRCEWGLNGIRHLVPISDVVIIIDALSFTTAVDVAVSRGAVVFPYRIKDESALDFARSMDAELAGPYGSSRYSLSPASLVDIPPATRIVLPSPNGATLSLGTGNVPTLAGCLRNARVVASETWRLGKKIAVIPAGERWRDDSSLRPAFEDLVGAGAVIAHLVGSLSPEAKSALAAYRAVENDLEDMLRQCSSGKELLERGQGADVSLAAQINVSICVPRLVGGAYQQG
jgi:2-phosphosulfolactate phosphatase